MAFHMLSWTEFICDESRQPVAQKHGFNTHSWLDLEKYMNLGLAIARNPDEFLKR